MADFPEVFGRHRVCGEEQTAALGQHLAGHLRRGDVVCLFGELGTGKSVMARAIAAALGVAERMPSPTYTIVEEYAGSLPVLHVDLYRIADEDEFSMLGIDEALAESVSLIEWADRVPHLAASAAVRVYLAIADDPDCRDVTIERGAR